MKRDPKAGARRWGEADGCRDGAIPDAHPGIARSRASDLEPLQRWRRTVVRLWLATMVLAVAVGVMLTAFRLPMFVEAAAALSLLTLAGFAAWNMLRGVCPFCLTAIRFRPRIELPPACPGCAAPFVVKGDRR